MDKQPTLAAPEDKQAFLRDLRAGAHETSVDLLDTGEFEVDVEFNPEITRQWNGLHLLMKFWLLTSIVTLPITVIIFYSFPPSIVGMVGASIYLCGCCKGGSHGVTYQRLRVLKYLSLVTAVISLGIVCIEVIKVIGVLHVGKHYLLLEYAASTAGHLLHGVVSSRVFKRTRVILEELETTLTIGIDFF